MSTYLTAAWLDAPVDPMAEAFAAAGGRLRLGRITTGAPDGDARFTAVVDAGRVTYLEGVGDDVEVTLTDTYANALVHLRGELDPNVSFMRGQTKVTGSTGAVVALLAATRSERYDEVRREQAEQLP